MGTTEEVELASRQNGRRCFCNNPLAFEAHSNGNLVTVRCWCERCERRSASVPGVINVYGYGRSEDAALANWLERQREW